MSETVRETAKILLLKDEGIKLKPYIDTVGKLTIGVGRNLDDKGISYDEAMYLLENDIKEAENDCKVLFAEVWNKLDDIRKAVLIDMMFNLGYPRFSTFRRMIYYVKMLDFDNAAKEMLDSKWATQVKGRAERLSRMMRTGEMDVYYLR